MAQFTITVPDSLNAEGVNFVEYLQSGKNIRGKRVLDSAETKVLEHAFKHFESQVKSAMAQAKKDLEAELGRLMVRPENRGKTIEQVAEENGIDLA